MLTLLTCLILGQSPSTPDDFAMTRAVEEFVIETIPAPRLLGDHVPPEVYARLMLLGDSCYRCREGASRELKAMGPPVFGWLIWNLHRKHAEARFRTLELVAYFAGCKLCAGSGSCAGYRRVAELRDECEVCGFDSYEHNYTYRRFACRRCNGMGGAFDPEKL